MQHMLSHERSQWFFLCTISAESQTPNPQASTSDVYGIAAVSAYGVIEKRRDDMTLRWGLVVAFRGGRGYAHCLACTRYIHATRVLDSPTLCVECFDMTVRCAYPSPDCSVIGRLPSPDDTNEKRAGGYVPSSSAADDYLNSLKADSQRKQRETQARLQGQPLSPREEPPLSASLPVEPGADVPQEVILAHRERLVKSCAERTSHEGWNRDRFPEYIGLLPFIFAGHAPTCPPPPTQGDRSSCRLPGKGLDFDALGPARPAHQCLPHSLSEVSFSKRSTLPFSFSPHPPNPTTRYHRSYILLCTAISTPTAGRRVPGGQAAEAHGCLVEHPKQGGRVYGFPEGHQGRHRRRQSLPEK